MTHHRHTTATPAHRPQDASNVVVGYMGSGATTAPVEGASNRFRLDGNEIDAILDRAFARVNRRWDAQRIAATATGRAAQ